MDKQPTKRRGPLTWLAGRSRQFWIVVALLPVLYFASWGPSIWLTTQFDVPESVFNASLAIYAPCQWIANHAPQPIRFTYRRYLMFWTGLVKFPEPVRFDPSDADAEPSETANGPHDQTTD